MLGQGAGATTKTADVNSSVELRTFSASVSDSFLWVAPVLLSRCHFCWGGVTIRGRLYSRTGQEGAGVGALPDPGEGCAPIPVGIRLRRVFAPGGSGDCRRWRRRRGVSRGGVDAPSVEVVGGPAFTFIGLVPCSITSKFSDLSHRAFSRALNRCSCLQSQKAATENLKRKQLLPFGFAQRYVKPKSSNSLLEK